MGGPGSGRKKGSGRLGYTRLRWCATCGAPFACMVTSSRRRTCSPRCRVLLSCEDRGVIQRVREFVHPVVRIAGSVYRRGEVPAAFLAPVLYGPWAVVVLERGRTPLIHVRDSRVDDLDRLAYEGPDYALAAAIRERLNATEALHAQVAQA